MVEKDTGSTRKAGLEESLHPEIGNGSAWEVNPHFSSLRNVDMAKALETLLYNPGELQKLVDKKVQIAEETAIEEVASLKKNGKKDKPKNKKKDKKSKSPVSPDDLDGDKEAFLEVVTVEGEGEEEGKGKGEFNHHVELDLPKPEVIQPEEKLPAEGKRMKKMIQAAEEENVRQPVTLPQSESSTETTLSPFTYWLKSLRGSEYVHPYNDDYALDQMANSTKGGISETFAELLAGQGYRDQAIEMYKLLMTRFPEKSSFFAAKIEALK